MDPHTLYWEHGVSATGPPGKSPVHDPFSYWLGIGSVQFSRSIVFDSSQPHELQHARPPCPSPTPGVHPDRLTSIESVMPSSHLILCCPLLLLSSLFSASESFPGGQSIGVSTLALSYQCIFRNDFLYNGLVGSPRSPRDSQESSPTPQFKSINSLALSFLYTPSLTSIHDYWKNHSFD